MKGKSRAIGENESVLYENLIDLDLRRGLKKAEPELDHRCQLFNCPSLLFDSRWLGTDEVRIELVTSSEHQIQQATAAFSRHFELAGLAGTVTSENVFGKTHRNSPEGCSAVILKKVKITKPVQPDPLLALVGVTLWVEPNKLEKLDPAKRWEYVGDESKDGPKPVDAIKLRLQMEQKRIADDQKFVLLSLKRLQKYKQLPAHQTKGADVFRYLQAKRQQLKALESHASGISSLCCCSICGCLVQAIGTMPKDKPIIDKLKPPSSKVTMEQRMKKSKSSATTNSRTMTKKQMEEKIEELESKIEEAKGKENKSKRKRYHKKIKELQEKMEGLHTRD